MYFFIKFIPILVFVLFFVGSGIYFTIIGTENAFYQLSPLVAIIPALATGWILHKGTTEERMNSFLDGARHRDIITMCIIFLLAGAFSEITKEAGSVDAVVNFALSFIPAQFLLIGLFIISSFIAIAIGTSMGTIATVAPIAAALAQGNTGFSPSLAVASVIGGAMFGDSLSIISDTTIAAVMSQEADMKAKLKLNAKIALIASIITIAILFFSSEEASNIVSHEYSFLLILPYVVLILLACFGVNVFTTLILSIGFAGIISFIHNHNHDLLFFNQNIVKGFASMQEIMLLSLMVGGLSGLVGNGIKELASELTNWIEARRGGQKLAQFFIAKTVVLFDILLANNTIAIIFSGGIAKDIAKKYRIPSHYTAAWLDIFSCVFQGIIPYGAQVLLASSIAKVSPLAIVPHVYFCYILGIVAVLYISFKKIETGKM
jgi:Na+/H+ antiporter NhaC